MTRLPYRPEIDGLRAIAVLAVVAYHAKLTVWGFPFCAGGFIGVDVFFVISGYLITSIILQEVGEGTFSLGRFYERRARRILPALFTVMAASIPFAWMFMLPAAMKDYAGSVLSALAFGSNIWFWQEGSYAAEPSALRPMLHTWSLSIEEQFYLLFPCMIVLLWKGARTYLGCLLALTFLFSLQLAHVASSRFPEAAFYLLPTRGWELLAGAILAQLDIERGRRSTPFLAVVMPTIGLVAIASAVLVYSDTMRHPSYWTLLPVAGTMILLWFARRGELVSDLLGSRPLVAIGLVSYSLYLWHFPVLAFARLKAGELSPDQKIGCIALSFVLAVASYFLVERPARRPGLIDRSRFLAATSGAFLGLLAANAVFVLSDGLPARLGPMATLIEDARRAPLVQAGRDCHMRRFVERCIFGKKQNHLRLVNLGDSHADVLGHSLRDLAEKHGLTYEHQSFSGCPYLIDTVVHRRGVVYRECNRLNRERREYFRVSTPLIIIYSSYGYGYAEGRFLKDNGEAGDAADTIDELLDLGHTVVLNYPVPDLDFHLPRRVKILLDEVPSTPVGLKQREYEQLDLGQSLTRYTQRAQRPVASFDSIKDRRSLIRVFPDALLCDLTTDVCRVNDGENLFYEDKHHLSPFGASVLVAEIERKLIENGVLRARNQ